MSPTSSATWLNPTARAFLASAIRCSYRFDRRRARRLLATTKCEEESRPFAGLRFGPHSAAVPVDDPLHDRESHPRPRKLGRAVQPLEHAEELLVVLHVEAGAVVFHEEDRRSAGAAAF